MEKASWEDRVNVMFQPKAWADQEFTNKWANEHFCPWLDAEHPNEETLLFCDGLDSHKTRAFLDILRNKRCFRCISPAECTDHIQAVDAGLGAQTKVLMSKEFQHQTKESS